MTAPIIGLTFGHSPERETWSEAHDRLIRDERVAALKVAKVPALHDKAPSRLSPVFILAAVLVVLGFGILVVEFGWKPVALGVVGAVVLTVLVGSIWLNTGRMAEEETDVGSGERPEVNRGDYPLDHRGR